MLLVDVVSFLINTHHHHPSPLWKAPHISMDLLILLDRWKDLRNQMSGCSTLRDHRDATGSIWLLLVVCPWLWSLCSSALIWEVPVNGGLFVLNLEPLALSEALCLVTRSIETFKSLNVARGSWPEALPRAHLHFCPLCYHHCTWSLQTDIELYIEAWIWGLVCLQRVPQESQIQHTNNTSVSFGFPILSYFHSLGIPPQEK